MVSAAAEELASMPVPHHLCCAVPCRAVLLRCRELCAAAATGPGLADMFARIMVSVDEDIISLEIPRSASGPGLFPSNTCMRLDADGMHTFPQQWLQLHQSVCLAMPSGLLAL